MASACASQDHQRVAGPGRRFGKPWWLLVPGIIDQWGATGLALGNQAMMPTHLAKQSLGHCPSKSAPVKELAWRSSSNDAQG